MFVQLKIWLCKKYRKATTNYLHGKWQLILRNLKPNKPEDLELCLMTNLNLQNFKIYDTHFLQQNANIY